ncbi:hypothetical protein Btru_007652 [Bulinus truncatus]|nr:hypothetical protein Btru_007652 [Bulinus truncatus]
MVDNSEKLKAYEVTILQRVECEKKAFDIVNRLVEDTVVGDYLIHCGQLIRREHYNDIVEERAITMICGYPICSNTLQNIPKKKFQISTKSNKVYNISERKKFCSNQCLKASIFFCNQIPESPLWAREKEILPEIKLFPLKLNTGLVGVEVVGESLSKNLKEELSKLEELDKKMSSLSAKEACLNDDLTTDSGNKHDTFILKDECANTGIIFDPNNTNIFRSDANVIDCQTGKSNTDISKNAKVLTFKSLQEETALDPSSVNSKLGHDSFKMTKVSKKNDSNPSLCKPAQKPESKMEQLKKILSQRKGVLSEMIIDMQPTVVSQCLSNEDSNSIKPQYTVTLQSDSLPYLNELRECKAYGLSSFPGQKDLRECKADNLHPLPCQKELRGCYSENACSDNKQLTGEVKKVLCLPLQRITCALKTWVTDETSVYLLPSPNESKENVESFSDPRLQKDYAQLCRRLNMQEKDFDNLINGIGDCRESQETKLKSVPNFELLKQETEQFQLKVVEFITGKKPETQKSSDEREDDSTNPVFLPNVDAYDQQQIRLKIVLYQLDKILPSLLTPLSLPVQLISTLVRELSSTFRACWCHFMFLK